MLSVYLILLLSLLVLYYAFLILPGEESEKKELTRLEEISVVIPFRNEAHNLPALLSSLEKQNKLPREIIFVNDHSEDLFLPCFEQLKLDYQLIDSTEEGKKAALKQGILKASGNFILSLDADVALPAAYFSSLEQLTQADLSILPVKMKGSGPTGIFASLDFYFLNALNNALSRIKQPLVANGANLLFRKKLYLDMLINSQSQHISSGDDQFLLREAKRNEGSIHLIIQAGLLVETAAPENFREFLHQRLRWIGKTKHVKDPAANLLAFLGLLYHLSGPVLIVFYPELYWLLAFKLFCDVAVFLPYLVQLKQASLLLFSPFFSLLYPFYVLMMGLSVFLLKPSWKGREVRQ